MKKKVRERKRNCKRECEGEKEKEREGDGERDGDRDIYDYNLYKNNFKSKKNEDYRMKEIVNQLRSHSANSSRHNRCI